MNKYFAEMIGTYALVFAGTGAIVVNDLTGGALTHVGISLVFGLVVMTMIYAIGNISGAHINPAVTLGFVVARRLPGRCAIFYILFQMIGAALASFTLLLLYGNRATLGATAPAQTALQSFALEAVLTAILMFVILQVSTGPKEIGATAGIAVGGVIAFEALIGGPISGASMNPARSFGPALVSGQLTWLWIYLLAPVLGACLAVPLWQLTCTQSQRSPSANQSIS